MYHVDFFLTKLGYTCSIVIGPMFHKYILFSLQKKGLEKSLGMGKLIEFELKLLAAAQEELQANIKKGEEFVNKWIQTYHTGLQQLTGRIVHTVNALRFLGTISYLMCGGVYKYIAPVNLSIQ